MNTSKRSLAFAWFALAGIPGDIWCAMSHVCRDGHLYHKEMPISWLYLDFIWIAAFVAAAVSLLRSDVPRRLIAFGLLLFLILSRLLFASGGGGLFVIVEVPVLIYVAVLAIVTIRRVGRQRIALAHETA